MFDSRDRFGVDNENVGAKPLSETSAVVDSGSLGGVFCDTSDANGEWLTGFDERGKQQ